MRPSLQDIKINYPRIIRMAVNFAGEIEKKYVSNFTDVTIKEYLRDIKSARRA
ncbi:MAG: hypothetical protein V1832_03815 [Nitrospirota bacterium]